MKIRAWPGKAWLGAGRETLPATSCQAKKAWHHVGAQYERNRALNEAPDGSGMRLRANVTSYR
jgi:hypothetical protein